MTIDEAKKILIRNNVPSYLYSFNKEDRSAECYVLEKRGMEWVIYFWERGQEGGHKLYSSENKAAKEFVNDVMYLVR